jgi:hypothetical protein
VPGGTLCFVTGLSPLGVTCLPPGSDPRLFAPLARNILVPGGLDVTLSELFAFTFGGREPVGAYVFFGAFTAPGAFADGRVDECQLLLESPATVTFSP